MTALIDTWYLSSEFSKNFYQKIRWRQNSSRISIRIPIIKSDDYGILQRLQRALLIIYQCRGVLWGFINTHELKHINVSVENMILKMNAKSRRLDFKKRFMNFHTNSKVIYPKYSKHWPYTVAYTIDCVCSKVLNHGLNHGLFLSLFKLIPCPKYWIVHVLAYLNFIFEFQSSFSTVQNGRLCPDA